MIKRRIWETVADKCLKPSINMARPARACKATSAIWLSRKVGGEAGGLHRPRPSDGGGRFPPEGGGAGRNPLPGKRHRRGRTSRRHPPSLKMLWPVYPFATGTATKRDWPPLFTRIKMLF